MNHKDGEVAAFKEAKPRIEALMSEHGIEAEVGSFFYMLPFAIRDPRVRQMQLDVQKREQFPLYHVQTPIIGVHSLDFYGKNRSHALDNGCLLETAVTHAGDLAQYSPTTPDVSTHSGVFVFPTAPKGSYVGPGSYTLEEFDEKKEEILQDTKKGFRNFSELVQSQGLTPLLENEPAANYERGVIDGFKNSPYLILSLIHI